MGDGSARNGARGGRAGGGFPGLNSARSGKMNHESQEDFGARGVKNFKAQDYQNDSF
jgi:hypothetical protein